MSLVGSLEDLGLGDILQIVSLSRKSGVLVLRSETGDGQIVLSDGLVRGASIKGEPEDLRGLLGARGLVTDEEFDRAAAEAERSGASLEDTVVENTGVDSEQIESLRRDHVERYVMRMFQWRSGEFSFEVRDAIDAAENELFLSSGINTQYLAMEATRLRDESGGLTTLREVVSEDNDTDDVPLFSGEAEEREVDDSAEAAPDPVDALALATVRNADAEGEEVSPGDADPPEASAAAADDQSAAATEEPDAETAAAPQDDPVESDAETAAAPQDDPVEPDAAPDAVAAAEAEPSTDASAVEDVPAEPATDASTVEDVPAEPAMDASAVEDVLAEPAMDASAVEDIPGDPATSVTPQVAAPAAEAVAESTPADPKPVDLVAIDPSLAGLEWFKASVDGMFRHIHIFQRSEIGIERIRRYLGRGIVPLVVLSPKASGDPMTDVRDVGELIRRLRTLAPQISIVALVEEDTSPSLPRGIDCVVERPASPGLDSEQWHRHEAAAQRLREGLGPWAGTGAAQAPPGPKSEELGELREVSARLRDPSSQGEVLSVVLDFAARGFSRVAIFVIRDEVAAGLAQRGMARAGGPGDEELARIEFDAEALPELFRAVLERRTSVRSPLDKANDHRLAMLIGARSPSEAYAAPIESGGCMVALLYADNLPDERPLADTTGLEIALHEAGLALDRALLERTLARSGHRG